MAAMSRASQSGAGNASGLSVAIQGAHVSVAARLLPPAKPRLRFERTIRNPSGSGPSASTAPSREALSKTIASKSRQL